jgi:hypothetical protein
LEATLKELWAVASPQHRRTARKLPLLIRKVALTIGDLLNKGTALMSRPDDGPSGSWAGVILTQRSSRPLDTGCAMAMIAENLYLRIGDL